MTDNHRDDPAKLRPIRPDSPHVLIHRDLLASLEAARAERDDLARWKAEAMPVLDGLQELGRALEVPLGERITGRRALEAVVDLRARLLAAERERDVALERIRRTQG